MLAGILGTWPIIVGTGKREVDRRKEGGVWWRKNQGDSW